MQFIGVAKICYREIFFVPIVTKGVKVNEKITDIQNLFWKAYKDFKSTKDMRQYNIDASKIIDKYKHDPVMNQFAVNLRFAWTPVINGIKEWS